MDCIGCVPWTVSAVFHGLYRLCSVDYVSAVCDPQCRAWVGVTHNLGRGRGAGGGGGERVGCVVAAFSPLPRTT
eukprot:409386-Rhodomonas_salina.1